MRGGQMVGHVDATGSGAGQNIGIDSERRRAEVAADPCRSSALQCTEAARCLARTNAACRRMLSVSCANRSLTSTDVARVVQARDEAKSMNLSVGISSCAEGLSFTKDTGWGSVSTNTELPAPDTNPENLIAQPSSMSVVGTHSVSFHAKSSPSVKHALKHAASEPSDSADSDAEPAASDDGEHHQHPAGCQMQPAGKVGEILSVSGHDLSCTRRQISKGEVDEQSAASPAQQRSSFRRCQASNDRAQRGKESALLQACQDLEESTSKAVASSHRLSFRRRALKPETQASEGSETADASGGERRMHSKLLETRAAVPLHHRSFRRRAMKQDVEATERSQRVGASVAEHNMQSTSSEENRTGRVPVNLSKSPQARARASKSPQARSRESKSPEACTVGPSIHRVSFRRRAKPEVQASEGSETADASGGEHGMHSRLPEARTARLPHHTVSFRRRAMKHAVQTSEDLEAADAAGGEGYMRSKSPDAYRAGPSGHIISLRDVASLTADESGTADTVGNESCKHKHSKSFTCFDSNPSRVSKHELQGLPMPLRRHSSTPINVDYAAVSAPKSRSGKVPYRRRKSSMNMPAVADGNDIASQAPSGKDESIQEIQRLPAVERDQSFMFYELPPIMITSVRYVSQESDEAGDERYAALHSQDQFTYLSSEEDDEDEHDFLGLDRELSSALREPKNSTQLYPSNRNRLDPASKSGKKQLFPAAESQTAIPSCFSCISGGTSETTQVMVDSIVPDFTATDNLEQCLVSLERTFAFAPMSQNFVERVHAIQRQQFAEDCWPEYSEDVGIAALDSRAQAAFAAAIAKSECASDQQGCTSACTSLRLDRFLANYFSDPDVFDVDVDLCIDMLKGKYRSRCYSPEQVAAALQAIPTLCKACLISAVHATCECELPDDPVRYLSTALQPTPVCCTSALQHDVQECAVAGVITSRNPLISPRHRYNRVRRVVLKHASTSAQETRELEAVLKSHGMPCRQDDKDSLICLAASYNDVKAVAVLFAYGSNLNETHQHEHGLSKHTALETCAIFGHVSVVSFLLDNGAFFGRSLHYAAKAGHANVVRLLLDSGAHPLVRIDGYSPLSQAVVSECFQVVEQLLLAGASVDTSLQLSVCFKLGLNPGQSIRDYALQQGLGARLCASLAKTPSSLAKTPSSLAKTPSSLAKTPSSLNLQTHPPDQGARPHHYETCAGVEQ